MLERNSRHRVHAHRLAARTIGNLQSFSGASGRFFETMREKERRGQCVKRFGLKFQRVQLTRLLEHLSEVADCQRKSAQRVVDCPSLLMKFQKLLRLFLTGKFLYETERVCIVLFRLGIGIELSRVITRMNQKFNSPRKVAASFEM